MSDLLKIISDNEILKEEIKTLLVKHGMYKEARELMETQKTINIDSELVIVFECKVCGKPFGDKLSLYEHYDEEHN